MISWHKVGQHVVCARSFPDESAYLAGETCPEVGVSYTVREVVPFRAHVGFRLEEIVNAPKVWLEGFGESAWLSTHFEPVYPHAVERLRDLCSPTPEQKREFFKELVDGHATGWRY